MAVDHEYKEEAQVLRELVAKLEGDLAEKQKEHDAFMGGLQRFRASQEDIDAIEFIDGMIEFMKDEPGVSDFARSFAEVRDRAEKAEARVAEFELRIGELEAGDLVGVPGGSVPTRIAYAVEAERAEKMEAKLGEAKATIAHMDQMDARRRKLCEDYEVRLRELGEMLGAREREQQALIKARDELQKLKQWTEKEDLAAHIEQLDSLRLMASATAVNQAKELRALQTKIKAQARELTIKEAAIVERNRALDAMHWVWCSGGCPSGTHRLGGQEPISEKHVATAERNTRRLREWFESNKRRKAREMGG